VSWQTEYQNKLVTPDYAASFINSGDVIGMGGGTGIPPAIAQALGTRAGQLENVRILQGFATGIHDYMLPQNKRAIPDRNHFRGSCRTIVHGMGHAGFRSQPPRQHYGMA